MTNLTDSVVDAFFEQVTNSLDKGSFVKLVLAKPISRQTDLVRIQIKIIHAKNEPCLSFVYRYATRDVTQNHVRDAALALLRSLVGTTFRRVHLLTHSQETQLLWSKRGKPALVESAKTSASPNITPHNREKHRYLDLRRPFLQDLGISDAEHRLVPNMARKWKQINKFIEIVDHALSNSNLANKKELRVIDFGAGKGYLTFGLHDYLVHQRGVNAQITGVELRTELVAQANATAQKWQCEGLRFELGEVRHYAAAPLDILIALHACDTATDIALHLGICSGASLIVCAPCCHQQLRPQLLSPHPLRPVLRHGIHLGQEADMVTDSLRALLLEAAGYDTQVFEFISLEHTAKNKMILGIKKPNATEPQITRQRRHSLDEMNEVKKFYGIREHALEKLLQVSHATSFFG